VRVLGAVIHARWKSPSLAAGAGLTESGSRLLSNHSILPHASIATELRALRIFVATQRCTRNKIIVYGDMVRVPSPPPLWPSLRHAVVGATDTAPSSATSPKLSGAAKSHHWHYSHYDGYFAAPGTGKSVAVPRGARVDRYWSSPGTGSACGDPAAQALQARARPGGWAGTPALPARRRTQAVMSFAYAPETPAPPHSALHGAKTPANSGENPPSTEANEFSAPNNGQVRPSV
jgi:hypothetical protein